MNKGGVEFSRKEVRRMGRGGGEGFHGHSYWPGGSVKWKLEVGVMPK